MISPLIAGGLRTAIKVRIDPMKSGRLKIEIAKLDSFSIVNPLQVEVNEQPDQQMVESM